MYKKNIHLTFTIESHTDSKGSDKYNLKLSEKRAKKVADYLIEKSIPKENVVAKGYGETKLINDCGNNSTCSDKEHALNRRTEIKLKAKKTDF
jgi:outer membrane protein OmpA-like peptidoglycan-associated protein